MIKVILLIFSKIIFIFKNFSDELIGFSLHFFDNIKLYFLNVIRFLKFENFRDFVETHYIKILIIIIIIIILYLINKKKINF
jgi:hypothetical protein